MGGFRSPKGVNQPKMPMMGSKGKVSGANPIGGLNTAPNMGFKKGGMASKKKAKK